MDTKLIIAIVGSATFLIALIVVIYSQFCGEVSTPGGGSIKKACFGTQSQSSPAAVQGPSNTPSQNPSFNNPPTVNLIGSWSYSGPSGSFHIHLSQQTIVFYSDGKYIREGPVLGVFLRDQGTYSSDGTSTINLYPQDGKPYVWPMYNIQEDSFDVRTETANFHFVRSK